MNDIERALQARKLLFSLKHTTQNGIVSPKDMQKATQRLQALREVLETVHEEEKKTNN